MTSQLLILPSSRPLQGSVPLPGDEGVALARLALATLSRGRTSLSIAGEQGGVRALLGFLSEVGVQVKLEAGTVQVHGVGLFGLRGSAQTLDLRGEAHVAALALALLVSRPFASQLLVDDVVGDLLIPALAESHPLSTKEAEGGGRVVELHEVKEGERSRGISVLTHGVFPWVKQALLIAGLRAKTETIVEEKLASADHLERAMTRSRMPIDVQGTVASLHPPRDEDAVAPQIYEALGSHSLVAPVAAVAMSVADSSLNLRDVGQNPTQSDVLSIIRLFGASMGVSPLGDRQGEPFGHISIRSAKIQPVRLGGETMIRSGDSALAFLGVAARAHGESLFTDMVPQARGGDPRIFGRAIGLLRSAGVEAETTEHGLRVVGRPVKLLEPLHVTTGGDARLAVLASILAVSARGESIIDDVECLRNYFPRWVGTLKALGVDIRVKSS